MDSERKKSLFSGRGWWLPVGAFVGYLVVISLLERVVPGGKGSTSGQGAAAVSAPAPPELVRLDDGAIEIRHDLFRRSTIRMGNEEDTGALYECLRQGFDEAFGTGTEGWTSARVRSETKRAQDKCLAGKIDLPTLPAGDG